MTLSIPPSLMRTEISTTRLWYWPHLQPPHRRANHKHYNMSEMLMMQWTTSVSRSKPTIFTDELKVIKETCQLGRKLGLTLQVSIVKVNLNAEHRLELG